jgi:hypothetical protein
MSKRFAAVVLASLGLVSVMAVPASAQELPKVEVSGGWDFARVMPPHGDAENVPKGWYIDAAANINKVLSIVATGGGNYKTVFDEPLKVHAWLAGVRFSSRNNAKAVPFVQLLAGNGRLSAGEGFSESKKGIDVGAGVTIAVRNNFGVRVGADYMRIFTKGDGLDDLDENVNVLRFMIGGAWTFGAK